VATGYLHDLADISSLKDGQLLTVTEGRSARAMKALCPLLLVGVARSARPRAAGASRGAHR